MNNIPNISIKNLENKLEETIQEANNLVVLAETATQEKTFFLKAMGKQISNPIEEILELTELLNKTNLDSYQKESLDTIIFSCNALQSIIKDVLDVSQVEKGILSIEKQQFDLKKVISEIIKLMHSKIINDVNLINDYDNSIDEYLNGDQGRIRQIITNLISNAIKFTKKGAITVKTEKVKADNHDITILFEVTDSGIGIDEDRIDAIFEEFTQEDDTTTRNYGGTGLGLPISKKLIELMGGKVKVESKKNIGTKFSFSISFEKNKTLSQ